jgi:hypothetical protein
VRRKLPVNEPIGVLRASTRYGHGRIRRDRALFFDGRQGSGMVMPRFSDADAACLTDFNMFAIGRDEAAIGCLRIPISHT